MFNEDIQRPIHRWRSGSRPPLFQPVQQLVGRLQAVRHPHEVKDGAAELRQLRLFTTTRFHRLFEESLDLT